MRAAPCGCDALAEATKSADESDPCVAATLRDRAREDQHAWRCPRAKHGSHGDPDYRTDPLDPAQTLVLQHLAALTSLPVTVARTCPGYYCTTPLSQAARLWRVRTEKRGARLGSLPAGIVPCVEALDAAIDARTAHDHEKFQQRMDAQREESERQRKAGDR